MTSQCLNEAQVLAFIAGTLLPQIRAATEAHLGTCTACADLTTWAAADLASAGQTAGREGRPFVGTLAPGSRVGRYQILGAVGRGGMGEVYAAYHPDLDRRIALKVVYESGASMAERRTRLLREARAIARLSHPNVVGVHDAGTVGDHVYVAMEFVDGQTVDEWLRSGERSWREILDVFVAAGRGLAAAHAADVIHRDFKPQNVMIGRDGVVRVMDFGLARLVEEAAAEEEGAPGGRLPEAGEAVPLDRVTRTGALLGTPAYMAPEQFRGEVPDARADQFSFCVALYEALYGVRPAVEPLILNEEREVERNLTLSPRRTNAPAWLRDVIRRGLAPPKELRYPSMAALMSALARGRARVRRRVSVAAASLALLVVASGGWRLARGNRIACAPPKERLAAAWTGNPEDPRRSKIKRAFAASGWTHADTSWRRVSSVLDRYIREWREMYVETCEATHVRGEQSFEVLDLRMSCLNDNLDQVSALTDALQTADQTVVSRAVSASGELTPVRRCRDLAVLRSKVPQPRDERTFREVREVRRALKDVEALRQIGREESALSKGLALQARVDATKYLPLRGEWLAAIGATKIAWNLDLSAQADLEEAVAIAASVHDDVTAAKASSTLVFLLGYVLRRSGEAQTWARLATAFLDRAGDRDSVIHAWLLNNRAAVEWAQGRFDDALALVRHAVTEKERILGPNHPDTAISIAAMATLLTDMGRAEQALEAAERGLAITRAHGDPCNTTHADLLSKKGKALALLGRVREASRSFDEALACFDAISDGQAFLVDALGALGEVILNEGDAVTALSHFERALEISHTRRTFAVDRAVVQFGVARALWELRRDRRRALALAEEAKAVFASHHHNDRELAAARWLADRRKRGTEAGTKTYAPASSM